MIEYYVFAIVVFVALMVYLYLRFRHIPRKPLTPDLKDKILRQGVVHYTTLDKAREISEVGLKSNISKAMYSKEKNMVWLYINEPLDRQKQLKIIRSKGKRKECDAVVIINKLSDKQIENMKYRKYDMAIIHLGDLRTSEMVVEKMQK